MDITASSNQVIGHVQSRLQRFAEIDGNMSIDKDPRDGFVKFQENSDTTFARLSEAGRSDNDGYFRYTENRYEAWTTGVDGQLKEHETASFFSGLVGEDQRLQASFTRDTIVGDDWVTDQGHAELSCAVKPEAYSAPASKALGTLESLFTQFGRRPHAWLEGSGNREKDSALLQQWEDYKLA